MFTVSTGDRGKWILLYRMKIMWYNIPLVLHSSYSSLAIHLPNHWTARAISKLTVTSLTRSQSLTQRSERRRGFLFSLTSPSQRLGPNYWVGGQFWDGPNSPVVRQTDCKRKDKKNQALRVHLSNIIHYITFTSPITYGCINFPQVIQHFPWF